MKRALEIADARMDLVRHSAEVGGSDVVGPLGFIVVFVRFVKDGVSIKPGAVFFVGILAHLLRMIMGPLSFGGGPIKLDTDLLLVIC